MYQPLKRALVNNFFPSASWKICGKKPRCNRILKGGRVVIPLIFPKVPQSSRQESSGFPRNTPFPLDTPGPEKEPHNVVAHGSFSRKIGTDVQILHPIILATIAPYWMLTVEWLFFVPVKGGRWHIIPQLAVYTTYIIYIYIYHLYIAFWGVICYLPPFTGTRNNHWIMWQLSGQIRSRPHTSFHLKWWFSDGNPRLF